MKIKSVTMQVETNATNKQIKERLTGVSWECWGGKTITVKQAQVNDFTPKRKPKAKARK